MAGSIAGLHTFAADVGPEPLSLLDNNFSPLATALNTLSIFSNPYIDSGAANAMVVTVPAPQVCTAYTDGLLVQVKVAAANTATGVTLNVNALGAKNVVQPDGTPLPIGALVAGGYYQFIYEATTGKFMLLGGGAAQAFGSGTAANPSITFNADLHTGLYQPGVSQLAITTNSNERLLVDSGGRITIFQPTTTGAAALNINASAIADQTLLLTGLSGGQASIQFNGNAATSGFLGAAGAANQLITGAATGDLCVRSQGNKINFSADSGGNIAAQVSGTALFALDAASGTLWEVGYRDLPIGATVTVNTTLGAIYRGKCIRANAAGITITLPTIASVGVNAVIVVFNTAAGNITVAANTGDALVLAGTNTTGSRTVGQNGICTCFAGVSGFWYLSGPAVS